MSVKPIADTDKAVCDRDGFVHGRCAWSNHMRALITGISGQDGSYLAELLLAKGYEVHGIIRRHSVASEQDSRIAHLHGDARLQLHYGDLSDGGALARLLHEVEPDEVYNLAAQSHVRVSFDQPIYSVDVDGLGVLRLLEAVRGLPEKRRPRVYQASSSEMFGSAPAPQSEATPFHPRSPYACAKVYAFHQAVNYREAYGLFAVNGILFNHESPRRGETFVTRKITRAATRIKLGLQDKLHLGNLDARRDWGFAGDYVDAMWRMLQVEKPGDFVIATGESHSVREFLVAVFARLDLTWQDHVEFDPRFLRPSEVDELRGDAANARAALGWEPRISFDNLVGMMVEHDLRLARREAGLSASEVG